MDSHAEEEVPGVHPAESIDPLSALHGDLIEEKGRN